MGRPGHRSIDLTKKNIKGEFLHSLLKALAIRVCRVWTLAIKVCHVSCSGWMDGPNHVLRSDQRLPYPLFVTQSKVLGFQMSTLGGVVITFWPVIVDVQCLLVKKKHLNLFSPYVVVAGLFKKWKSGYNLQNKKALPVTEYYYLFILDQTPNLNSKEKQKRKHTLIAKKNKKENTP